MPVLTLAEHRRRVETRVSDIAGMKVPTWEEVLAREYDAWQGDRIIVDTAGRSTDESLKALITCAVTRRDFSVGVSPTRQLSLRPVAIGAVVEVTKRQKPSMKRVT